MVQCGWYINLDHRTDKREETERELKRMSLQSVVRRFPAICNRARPEVGCSQSHLEVLKQAREIGAPHVLVFEDDFALTTTPAEFESMMAPFLESAAVFDVLMLACDLRRWEPAAPRFPPGVIRVLEAGTACGYLVHARAFDDLIRVWEAALPELIATRQHWKYACDVAWKPLQQAGRWFTFETRPGRQRPGISDMSGLFVDNGC